MGAWTTQRCHGTIPSHPCSPQCPSAGAGAPSSLHQNSPRQGKKYKTTLSARKKYTFAAEGSQGKGVHGFCGQEQKSWLIAKLNSRPTETQPGLLVPRELHPGVQELLSLQLPRAWEFSFLIKHLKALPTLSWRSPCPARASPSASSAFGCSGFPPAATRGVGGDECPWRGVQGWVTPWGAGLG